MARVTLYAHRLVARRASGVQRYTDGLLSGLEEAAGPPWELTAVSPDPVRPGRSDGHVAYRSVRLPRKIIHGLWYLAPLPPLEALVGRTELVHVISTAIPVRSRAPQVITIHDLFTVRHPEWFEPRSARMTLKSLRLAVRSARRIIVPSSFVAADVAGGLDVEPARISVVPEGVNARFTTEQADADQADILARYELRPSTYMVMVGLLSPRKNLKVLAEAWDALRSRRSERLPTLVVIGPVDVGHESVRLEVGRRGLGDRIRFTGFVPDSDLQALLANAIALLHPSLDEGFGLTPLEAMAAGVPALVSKSGSIPEVTGDAAWQLDPGRPEAWADAVERIQDDSDLRASMIAAGRRRAAAFTWSATALQTLSVYRDALAET